MPPPPAPFGSATHVAEKDVQALLLKQKSFRRRPGEVPYPLKYSTDTINFDNWDQMFLKSCFGGLTMHQFDTPPNIILDLGCGGGYWAMEAAKKWPNAQIIGFDLKVIQPELLELEANYMRCLEDGGQFPHSLPLANELAGSINWIHGNFLDGLPFRSDYFDFVHISGIGLGVPEDEWQYVLEEVARVMQCNGVLEIIEEDLIFPCAPPLPTDEHLAPLSLNFARDRKDPAHAFSTQSSNTILSNLWSLSVPDSREEHRVQKRPSLPALPEIYTDALAATSIPFEIGSPEPPLISRNAAYFPKDSDLEIATPGHHSVDHTRLKTAWDSMLARRFLAGSVIAVLPFYLTSLFGNVQTHPPLQIPLPPSSVSPASGPRSSDNAFDADTPIDLNPSVRQLSDADMYAIKSKSTVSTHRMHLAKMVNTVAACKESIYLEYERIIPNDLPPIVTKSARPKDAQFLRSKHSPREAFETDWFSWEKDMADRIAMRGCIASKFGWTEPEPAPDWCVWRNRISSLREELPGANRVRPNLCRSVRAFVGRKPAAS